ncbi:hypothetical protein AK973_5537 [Pseudomonas brassicacearum]|nr:hypothetical protein AK973_5537 [Pseudomonas brassicacearum]
MKRRGHQANRYRYRKRRQFTLCIASCPRVGRNLADTHL